MLSHPLVAHLVAGGREIGRRMGEHRVSLAAGGLAYFVMLAIAPAAVVIGSILGWFITPAELQTLLTNLEAHSVIKVSDSVTSALNSVLEHYSATAFTITGVISVLIAVYAASKMLYGLRMALDASFSVPHASRSLIQRAIATVGTLILLIAIAALLLALAVVPAILNAIGLTDIRVLTGLRVVDWLILLVIAWILVRLSYRFLNGAKPRLPWYALGPIGAALAIMLASAGVGYYAQYSSTMGAALAVFGSPVVILLWLYLGFYAMLIGAEFEGMLLARKAAGQGSDND